MSRAARIAGWFTVSTVLYFTSYWLLMVRDLPSIGRDGEFQFRSSPRIGPSIPINDGITVYHGKTSVLNYLFYPADVIYDDTRDAMRGHKP